MFFGITPSLRSPDIDLSPEPYQRGPCPGLGNSEDQLPEEVPLFLAKPVTEITETKSAKPDETGNATAMPTSPGFYQSSIFRQLKHLRLDRVPLERKTLQMVLQTAEHDSRLVDIELLDFGGDGGWDALE
jgi:hypothetical protein